MSESISGWFTKENGKHEPIILNDDGVFLLDGSEVILGYPISLSISLDSNNEPSNDEPIRYIKYMTSDVVNNIKYEIDHNFAQTRLNVEKWLFKQDG